MGAKFGRVVTLLSATLLIGSLAWVPGVDAAGNHAAGVHVPTCFGKKATIVSNKATINGTNRADVIVGGSKHNTIYGKGGADRICSGGGNDVVYGGGGGDKINTGPGVDRASGGTGPDLINGGGGNDGTFECLNNSFQPTVFLGGGAGNDKVYGGDGNDCLGGGAGADQLFGQNGNDILFGDPGADTLNGGANGNPLVDPTQLGDTASYAFMSVFVNANLTTGQATSNGQTDTLNDIENLFGTSFDDTLIGNAASTLAGPVNGLEGGLGDDTIDGNDGDIEIAAFLLSPGAETVGYTAPGSLNGLAGGATGGEGTDSLDNITGVAGSNFGDTITWVGLMFGGGGDDAITAASFGVGSIISGGAGNDNINGSSSNDQISGDAGDDTITGGAGNDALDGDTGGVNIGGTNDSADGGDGTDDTCVDFESVLNCEHP